MDNQTILQYLDELFGDFWNSPHEMKEEIKSFFNINQVHYKDLIVTGETENLTLYLITEEDVTVFCPKSDIRENKLLNRWDCNWAHNFNQPLHISTIKLDKKLIKQLELPKMLLINLSVIENFPIPRLNLSIGTLASYLRNKQLADVTIIDMQVGVTLEGIVEKALEINPSLIGMSVNFGQKQLAFSLTEKLFNHKLNGSIDSLIVCGNVIPTFSPEQFFEKFPEVLIADKEGEYTLEDLSLLIKNEITIEDVRGVQYFDRDQNTIKYNPTTIVKIEEVPTPALDTLKVISKLRGALTLETSRGCDYSLCTFCPRDHKMRSWRPFTVEQTLKQVDDLVKAGTAVGIKPHIYFADEEFVGELPDGKEADRIINICKGLLKRKDKIKFDIAVRADSVYEPKRSKEWNVERFKMWYYLAKAGVDRVFIGVESGSEKQLKRYGKGTKPEQNIVALRILSALGIKLRIGFIMFDQMMEGFDDLKENLNFLEREDAVIKTVDMKKMSFEELYDKLVLDKKYIKQHQVGRPVHSIVSYMLASMEVLMNSPYSRMLKLTEKKRDVELVLNDGKPDTNMARYAITFLDKRVGELSLAAQKWIDSNFSIMYTTKSLYKVASNSERGLLYNFMVRHREISHFLLKFLISCIEENYEIDSSFKEYLIRENFLSEVEAFLQQKSTDTSLKNQILLSLSMWQLLMERLVIDMKNDLDEDKITDSVDDRLKKSLNTWIDKKDEWALINKFELV
ncbi:B12-binding domain-containing radical SAM protein [Bacillus sp. SCS-151]|uniref:B12-binding domain-containing radical SAM protein n=1 Tax=Nanhaiella sioensis TaxID=3115293 RepID=UPI0039786C9D